MKITFANSIEVFGNMYNLSPIFNGFSSAFVRLQRKLSKTKVTIIWYTQLLRCLTNVFYSRFVLSKHFFLVFLVTKHHHLVFTFFGITLCFFYFDRKENSFLWTLHSLCYHQQSTQSIGSASLIVLFSIVWYILFTLSFVWMNVCIRLKFSRF